ncbi:MAG: dienelactone hydrolase family protein [Bryobacteraceae bacterium]
MSLPIRIALLLIVTSTGTLSRAGDAGQPSPRQLKATKPLTLDGDISDMMIAGVDRFLLRELNASIERRKSLWRRDVTSNAAYQASVEPNRQRFAKMIGLRDERAHPKDIELVATLRQPALIGRGAGFEVFAVRWPALEGVHAEGLLLEPAAKAIRANVVVIPDSEQLPEALAGLQPGIGFESQIARRLAESGCRVLVPMLINRGNEFSVLANGKRKSTVTHREFLYRSAYQMGRHLIGYETQKVLAAVDWMHSRKAKDTRIGVIGYGEGGLIALYSAAIDPRIDVTGVSGYFDTRQDIWREPIDRNVFGLLREFGDAELASLIAPRALIIEASAGPSRVIPAGGQSAPGSLSTPKLESVQREVQRAKTLVAGLRPTPIIELVTSRNGAGPFGTNTFLQKFLDPLTGSPLAPLGPPPASFLKEFDPNGRLARQFKELGEFSQRLVDDGPRTRADFFSRIDRSGSIESFVKSGEPYREFLRSEIVGVFEYQLEPANPRTRLLYDEPEFRGYEVTLDVFPDVILYGILLVPRDLQPGEKRPVVVCQHGLEGRAKFTTEGDSVSYRAFAARLAKRGFVTFSPQHLYRGGDHFRTLQRKANPLKRSLFSIMVAQHQQLLDWLKTVDFVDPQRIAFYGISYGGKSAMRIPAILDGYALSICSSDFSDWITRTVSNRFKTGYLAHMEYEIFEFNLGSTFNYGELAALICPRPFMAEIFHRDGPATESTWGEFARVGLLYTNLGIPERARLTYYSAWDSKKPYLDRETFGFLHEYLKWRSPATVR